MGSKQSPVLTKGTFDEALELANVLTSRVIDSPVAVEVRAKGHKYQATLNVDGESADETSSNHRSDAGIKADTSFERRRSTREVGIWPHLLTLGDERISPGGVYFQEIAVGSSGSPDPDMDELISSIVLACIFYICQALMSNLKDEG